MMNVAVAFEILEPGDPIPVGWTKSSGHMVFDLKMDFTRKATRWVKMGIVEILILTTLPLLELFQVRAKGSS